MARKLLLVRRMKFRLTVICILILICATSFAASKAKLYGEILVSAKVADCVADLQPTISELHALAIKYARLSPTDLTRWKKKIKYSALLPRLQFGYERKVTDSFDVDLEDSVSVTSSAVNVGPTSGGWGRGLDRNHNFEVTAVWYLDELLFNRDDLSISSEVRAQLTARRGLLGEITEDYSELKRLISIYHTKSEEANEVKGRIRFEIEKLIGRIDGMTGGWFTRRFKWKDVKCGKI